MRKLYFTSIVFIFAFSAISQENSGNFTAVLKSHIKRYNIQCDLAFAKNDAEKGQVLFDSLVSNHLIGTTFDDYTLKGFEKKKITLSKIHKPIFILTYASWCVPSKGEIPALNKLAQQYAKDVKFVVLFWDKKHSVKKIAQKFDHNISVCYAHESYKNDANLVANLKHTLGFPTSYFLDENLKVINVKRGGAHPNNKSTYVIAYTMNYNSFREGLSSLLLEKEITTEALTTN